MDQLWDTTGVGGADGGQCTVTLCPDDFKMYLQQKYLANTMIYTFPSRLSLAATPPRNGRVSVRQSVCSADWFASERPAGMRCRSIAAGAVLQTRALSSKCG